MKLAYVYQFPPHYQFLRIKQIKMHDFADQWAQAWARAWRNR